ncbi:hypothetical protein [Saccharopolyspora sp. 7B]|uniref:hypothetical protein n=1 Tax=Saccharopolyspora sp. 7B TaxID=2877240 RepID=UPI001CD6CA65|nr:hypothetical protein [Saccharopolyspora sp. 7B]MCA1280951.1 hypothetical protein [Saccharopolyspora sp. 7B]
MRERAQRAQDALGKMTERAFEELFVEARGIVQPLHQVPVVLDSPKPAEARMRALMDDVTTLVARELQEKGPDAATALARELADELGTHRTEGLIGGGRFGAGPLEALPSAIPEHAEAGPSGTTRDRSADSRPSTHLDAEPERGAESSAERDDEVSGGTEQRGTEQDGTEQDGAAGSARTEQDAADRSAELDGESAGRAAAADAADRGTDAEQVRDESDRSRDESDQNREEAAREDAAAAAPERRKRLRLPSYLSRGRGLGAGVQLSRTEGADQVVRAVTKSVGGTPKKSEIDALGHAVRNEFGSFLGDGRVVSVGKERFRITADLDWSGRTPAEAAASSNAASTGGSTGSKAATSTGRTPMSRWFFFVPTVPGMFVIGAVNVPTDVGFSRSNSRENSQSTRMTVALPETVADGASGYRGMTAQRVPATFTINRLDSAGDPTLPTTFVGRTPGADPVAVELSVPVGLGGEGREVAVPEALPPSVVENADVRGQARGRYRGKRLARRFGRDDGIFEQVAAHLGKLSEDGQNTLRSFLGSANVKQRLPEMAVTPEQAAKGRGWIQSDALLPGGNPLKRLLPGHTRAVQMRLVARKVAYEQTIEGAHYAEVRTEGSSTSSANATARDGSGSLTAGPGYDVGVVSAAAGVNVALGGGHGRTQEYGRSTGSEQGSSHTGDVVRYRTVYDLQVRKPGDSPITFAEAVEAHQLARPEDAGAAGITADGTTTAPVGRQEVADAAASAALDHNAASELLSRIMRDSAAELPGHHRWKWRDTSFVTEFDDPKLSHGIDGKGERKLARGEQIHEAVSPEQLVRRAPDMVADRPLHLDLQPEPGRGNDYRASFQVKAELQGELRPLGPAEGTPTSVALTESESGSHAKSRSWSLGGGVVARLYTALHGTGMITTQHKGGYSRTTGTELGQRADSSTGGVRGGTLDGSGNVRPEPMQRYAATVKLTTTGQHWSRANELVRGVTVGSRGLDTPELHDLRIVDESAAAEGREPGTVTVDVVVELPASHGPLRLEVAPENRTELADVSINRSAELRRGASRKLDGLQVVAFHGLEHVRDSVRSMLAKASNDPIWHFADGDNSGLIDQAISVEALRGDPRAFSRRTKLTGFRWHRRRSDVEAAAAVSYMLRDPEVVETQWQQPKQSTTGATTSGQDVTGTWSGGNAVEPAMITFSETSNHTPGTSAHGVGLFMHELSLWMGSFSKKTGHRTEVSAERALAQEPRRMHLINAKIETTVAAEAIRRGNLDRWRLRKPKPVGTAAERFELPGAVRVLVTDEQLHEIRIKQAEEDARRAAEQAEQDPPELPPPDRSADPGRTSAVPDGARVGAPRWAGGVTEAIDLVDRIDPLYEQLVRTIGQENADRLLPASSVETPHDNHREVERALSQLQASLEDLANGGVTSLIRREFRVSGETYELRVDASLLGEPELTGIKHGELSKATSSSFTTSVARKFSRVLVEAMTMMAPAGMFQNESALHSAEADPNAKHGAPYGNFGFGGIHVLEWLKQTRDSKQDEVTQHQHSESVRGALAEHRAEVLFDVRIERHGERVAAAPDTRTITTHSAVEDARVAPAGGPRKPEVTARTAADATPEALSEWRDAGNPEALPTDPAQYRVIDFDGDTAGLVDAAEQALAGARADVDPHVRTLLRAELTPSRLAALLDAHRDSAEGVPLDLPPELGVRLTVHPKVPGDGELVGASGRIQLGGSTTSTGSTHTEVATGNGNVVAAVPIVAAGVPQAPHSATYADGRTPFGATGDWALAMEPLGAAGAEHEQQGAGSTGGAELPAPGARPDRSALTSTWAHGAEFRFVAEPTSALTTKRTAVVDAEFAPGDGYVLRRADRTDRLPESLVRAAEDFAARDREWAEARAARRAADPFGPDVRDGDLGARAEEEFAFRTATEAEQAAEAAWWQAKQHYDAELAAARHDPGLSGTAPDQRLELPRAGEQLPPAQRAKLYSLAREVVRAHDAGTPVVARYRVTGELGLRSAQDFSAMMSEVDRSLRLAQYGRPGAERLRRGALGMGDTPHFVNGDGPTRVEIWLEPDPAARLVDGDAEPVGVPRVEVEDTESSRNGESSRDDGDALSRGDESSRDGSRPDDEPRGRDRERLAPSARSRSTVPRSISQDWSRPSHPTPDLTDAAIERAYGITTENQRLFQEFVEEHGLVVDVRPTNPDSVRLLKEGAYPKPLEIKAKTINRQDVRLGAPEHGLGAVGFFEPKLPEDLTEAEAPGLRERARQRLTEYRELFSTMKDLAKQYWVEDGVVRTNSGLDEGGASSGRSVPVAGDHDVFNIRSAEDGRVLPEGRYHEMVRELVARNMGVQHGAHRYWNPRRATYEATIFDTINRGHDPGHEPLIRFAPGEPPAEVHADLPDIPQAGADFAADMAALAERYLGPEDDAARSGRTFSSDPVSAWGPSAESPRAWTDAQVRADLEAAAENLFDENRGRARDLGDPQSREVSPFTRLDGDVARTEPDAEPARTAEEDVRDGYQRAVPPELALPEQQLRDRTAELTSFGDPAALERHALNPGTPDLLGRLGARIDALPDEARRQELRSLVADAVLAATTVPVRTAELPRGGTERFPLRAITPSRLDQLLVDAEQALRFRLDPLRTAGQELTEIGYRADEPMPARLARLGLLALNSPARQATLAEPLFSVLLANPEALLNSWFGATGNERQLFLNTCMSAAINSEVRASVPTLAGLLQVGRGAADVVLHNLGRVPKARRESWENAFGRTYEDMVRSRVEQSQAVFDELRADGLKLVREGGGRAEWTALTERWSRTMQKLSGASLREKPPVLTDQILPGRWALSTLLALPRGFDRPFRRMQGVDGLVYTEALRTRFGLEPDASPFGGNGAQSVRPDRLVPLPEVFATPEGGHALWQRVAERAGVVVYTPGHALFLRAADQDGAPVFVVHDPKYDSSTTMRVDEFAELADRRSISVSPRLLPDEDDGTSTDDGGTPRDDDGPDEGTDGEPPARDPEDSDDADGPPAAERDETGSEPDRPAGPEPEAARSDRDDTGSTRTDPAQESRTEPADAATGTDADPPRPEPENARVEPGTARPEAETTRVESENARPDAENARTEPVNARTEPENTPAEPAPATTTSAERGPIRASAEESARPTAELTGETARSTPRTDPADAAPLTPPARAHLRAAAESDPAPIGELPRDLGGTERPAAPARDAATGAGRTGDAVIDVDGTAPVQGPRTERTQLVADLLRHNAVIADSIDGTAVRRDVRAELVGSGVPADRVERLLDGLSDIALKDDFKTLTHEGVRLRSGHGADAVEVHVRLRAGDDTAPDATGVPTEGKQDFAHGTDVGAGGAYGKTSGSGASAPRRDGGFTHFLSVPLGTEHPVRSLDPTVGFRGATPTSSWQHADTTELEHSTSYTPPNTWSGSTHDLFHDVVVRYPDEISELTGSRPGGAKLSMPEIFTELDPAEAKANGGPRATFVRGDPALFDVLGELVGGHPDWRDAPGTINSPVRNDLLELSGGKNLSHLGNDVLDGTTLTKALETHNSAGRRRTAQVEIRMRQGAGRGFAAPLQPAPETASQHSTGSADSFRTAPEEAPAEPTGTMLTEQGRGYKHEATQTTASTQPFNVNAGLGLGFSWSLFDNPSTHQPSYVHGDRLDLRFDGRAFRSSGLDRSSVRTVENTAATTWFGSGRLHGVASDLDYDITVRFDDGQVLAATHHVPEGATTWTLADDPATAKDAEEDAGHPDDANAAAFSPHKVLGAAETHFPHADRLRESVRDRLPADVVRDFAGTSRNVRVSGNEVALSYFLSPRGLLAHSPQLNGDGMSFLLGRGDGARTGIPEDFVRVVVRAVDPAAEVAETGSELDGPADRDGTTADPAERDGAPEIPTITVTDVDAPAGRASEDADGSSAARRYTPDTDRAADGSGWGDATLRGELQEKGRIDHSETVRGATTAGGSSGVRAGIGSSRINRTVEFTGGYNRSFGGEQRTLTSSSGQGRGFGWAGEKFSSHPREVDYLVSLHGKGVSETFTVRGGEATTYRSGRTRLTDPGPDRESGAITEPGGTTEPGAGTEPRTSTEGGGGFRRVEHDRPQRPVGWTPAALPDHHALHGLDLPGGRADRINGDLLGESPSGARVAEQQVHAFVGEDAIAVNLDRVTTGTYRTPVHRHAEGEFFGFRDRIGDVAMHSELSNPTVSGPPTKMTLTFITNTTGSTGHGADRTRNDYTFGNGRISVAPIKKFYLLPQPGYGYSRYDVEGESFKQEHEHTTTTTYVGPAYLVTYDATTLLSARNVDHTGVGPYDGRGVGEWQHYEAHRRNAVQVWVPAAEIDQIGLPEGWDAGHEQAKADARANAASRRDGDATREDGDATREDAADGTTAEDGTAARTEDDQARTEGDPARTEGEQARTEENAEENSEAAAEPRTAPAITLDGHASPSVRPEVTERLVAQIKDALLKVDPDVVPRTDLARFTRFLTSGIADGVRHVVYGAGHRVAAEELAQQVLGEVSPRGVAQLLPDLVGLGKEWSTSVDGPLGSSRVTLALRARIGEGRFDGTDEGWSDNHQTKATTTTGSSSSSSRSHNANFSLRSPIYTNQQIARSVGTGAQTTGSLATTVQRTEESVSERTTSQFTNGDIARFSHPIELELEVRKTSHANHAARSLTGGLVDWALPGVQTTTVRLDPIPDAVSSYHPEGESKPGERESQPVTGFPDAHYSRVGARHVAGLVRDVVDGVPVGEHVSTPPAVPAEATSARQAINSGANASALSAHLPAALGEAGYRIEGLDHDARHWTAVGQRHPLSALTFHAELQQARVTRAGYTPLEGLEINKTEVTRGSAGDERTAGPMWNTAMVSAPLTLFPRPNPGSTWEPGTALTEMGEVFGRGPAMSWQRTDAANLSGKKTEDITLSDGEVYLVEARTKWTLTPEYRGEAPAEWTTPRTAHDTVYVRTDENGLRAMGLEPPKKDDDGSTSDADEFFDAEDGPAPRGSDEPAPRRPASEDAARLDADRPADRDADESAGRDTDERAGRDSDSEEFFDAEEHLPGERRASDADLDVSMRFADNSYPQGYGPGSHYQYPQGYGSGTYYPESSGYDHDATPGTTVPIASDFSSPRSKIFGRDDRGRKLGIPLSQIDYEIMPSTGDYSEGISFRRTGYALTESSDKFVQTLPGESVVSAAARTKRPGDAQLDGNAFFVDVARDGDGYRIRLRDGRAVTVSPETLGAIVARVNSFRTLQREQNSAGDPVPMSVVLLSSPRAKVSGVLDQLREEGFHGEVLRPRGDVTQLADGRFGVAGNEGWSRYGAGSGSSKFVYSKGNVRNIEFFERYLPNAEFIPDHDKAIKVTDKNWKEYWITPSEARPKAFTTRAGGVWRVNGLSFVGKKHDVRTDAAIADALDGFTRVVRTRPGEGITDKLVRRLPKLSPEHDPTARLAALPWKLERQNVLDVTTGKAKSIRTGPALLSSHGNAEEMTMHIKRGDQQLEMWLPGSSFIYMLVQQKEFQDLYAANPGVEFAVTVCEAGAEGAKVLPKMMEMARRFTMPNRFFTGADTISMIKLEDGDRKGATIGVDNNKGWVSAYVASDGQVVHNSYPHTRYSDEELETLPFRSKISSGGHNHRGTGPVPLSTEYLNPNVSVRAQDEQGRPLTLPIDQIGYHRTAGDSGLGVAFGRPEFRLDGDADRVVATMPGETVEQAAGHEKRPGHESALPKGAKFYAEAANTDRGFRVPLVGGRHAFLRGDALAAVIGQIPAANEFLNRGAHLALLADDVAPAEVVAGLSRQGFESSVISTGGKLGQLPDGRLGAAGNAGFTTTRADGTSSTHGRFSAGNVENIAFFESELPRSEHIPDADAPIRGVDLNGEPFEFLPHEVHRAGYRTGDDGGARTTAVDFTGADRSARHGVNPFKLLAEQADSTRQVARTRPGEEFAKTSASGRRRLGTSDPLQRLVDSPWTPTKIEVTDPATGQRKVVDAGPNMLGGHGSEHHVGVLVHRNGVEHKVRVSGADYIRTLAQTPEFRDMRRANPHSPYLLTVCKAGGDGGSTFSSAVRELRSMSVRNEVIAARDVLDLTVTGNKPIVSVVDNQGWVSSRIEDGAETPVLHEGTRYTAAELATMIGYRPGDARGPAAEHSTSFGEDGGPGPSRGPRPSREAIIAEVDRLAKKCTCKQNKKQWGRVTHDVVVRYARSYEGDRTGQSLRHLDRQMYNAVVAAERRERTGDAEPVADGQKVPAAVAEQELQTMLHNGHLVFASNYNRSVFRLHDVLSELSGTDRASDLGDSDALQRLVQQDFGEPGRAGADSDGEAPPAVPPKKGPGKRASGVPDGGGKRRRTLDGVDDSEQQPGGKAMREIERRRRDRQAMLKVREGLTPDEQAMDVDGSGNEVFKRDNETLQALRQASHIRLVDISNDKANDPAYREYLAKLLSDDAEYAGYAYLVYDGDGAGKMHAEQKLLQLLQNAGITAETQGGPTHLRGTKRPCDPCLSLLRYFRDKVGLDLRFNDRGNHYYRESLETGVRHLAGYDESKGPELGEHLRDDLGDPNRVMYMSAPKHTRPAPAGSAPGLRGVELGAEGGEQQRYTVPEKTRDAQGEPVLEFPPDSDIQGMVDTASNSEAEDDAPITDLVAHTRHLRIGNRPGAEAPEVKEPGAVRKQRERAHFDAVVAPQLQAAAGEAFWREVEARPPRGGKFTLEFPDELRHKIKELIDATPELKPRISERLRMTTIAMDKQLGKIGGSTRKLAYRVENIEGAEARLAAAMPAEFRAMWEAEKRAAANEGRDPKKLDSKKVKFTEAFEDVLHAMVNEGEKKISANSVAQFLLMPENTFKSRMQNIAKKRGAGS